MGKVVGVACIPNLANDWMSVNAPPMPWQPQTWLPVHRHDPFRILRTQHTASVYAPSCARNRQPVSRAPPATR